METDGRRVYDNVATGEYEYWAGREKGKKKRGAPALKSGRRGGAAKRAKSTPSKKKLRPTEIATEDKRPAHTKGGGEAEIQELTEHNNELRGQLALVELQRKDAQMQVALMWQRADNQIKSLNQQLKMVYILKANEEYKQMDPVKDFPEFPCLASFFQGQELPDI